MDCLDRGLRGFSQMAYDAPRPFVPGFWVAACAGKTGGCGNDGLFTLPGFWVPACAGKTGGCGNAGMTGCSPSPRVQARGRL